MKRKLFFDGAKSAIPICLGIVPVGISYGLLAMQAGLSRFQTVLMSALVMAGSSQLMAVEMIGSAAIGSMIMAVFFVNLRHVVMSSSVMNRLGYAPLTWFSPATRIRLSGVRTLMRTLHFCVRLTVSLMKLRYSSCGARASVGRNWIQFLYRLAK